MLTETEITHEGKELLDYLSKNNLSRKELCTRMGMSLPLLTYYSRKPHLSARFKTKLKTAGIALFDDEAAPAQLTHQYILELQEEIKLLTQVIALQKQFITHVTQHCRNGHCLNFVLDTKKAQN